MNQHLCLINYYICVTSKHLEIEKFSESNQSKYSTFRHSMGSDTDYPILIRFQFELLVRIVRRHCLRFLTWPVFFRSLLLWSLDSERDGHTFVSSMDASHKEKQNDLRVQTWPIHFIIICLPLIILFLWAFLLSERCIIC